MGNIFDRLSQGMGGNQGNQGNQSGGYDNWNEMVGSAPPDRFGRAAYDAVRGVDPREYQDHVTPGVGGTDPLGAMDSGQRSGLAQKVLGELFRRGMSERDISQQTGVRNLNPNSMGAADLGQLLGWMQQSQPKAYGRVATQYKDQPNMLEGLLGNKAMMGMLATLGAGILMNKMRR